MTAGWGTGAWGSEPWGSPTGLSLEAAVAVVENEVQLAFSEAVYFSGLLDPADASDPTKYTVTPVGGTGLDGTAPRPVRVVSVAVVAVPGAPSGQYLALTLDRPMTPYPANYAVTVSPAVLTADMLTAIDPDGAALGFPAVFKQLVVPQQAAPLPARDLANPQTLAGALDPLPDPFNPANLGTLNVDDSGDYAFDSGLQSLKKRVFRRLMTVPGGFLHLGDAYGIGVTTYSKKLATAATRGRLAAQCEAQIAQEPEVAKVAVRVLPSATGNGLFRLVVLARLKATGQTVKFASDLPG